MPLLSRVSLSLALLSSMLALVGTTGNVHAAEPAASAPASAPIRILEEKPRPQVGYEGGFFIRSDVFELKLHSRLQARYTAELLDDADNEMAFSLPRVRLVLSGHVFSPRLAYYFQLDFGKGNAALKDYFVDYTFKSWLRLRVGQWKVPFTRHHVMSTSKIALIDRAITHDYLGVGRDVGLALHNDYEHAPRFEYVLALFNGTGAKPAFSGTVLVDPLTGEGTLESAEASNVPSHLHPTLVARVGYNHGGMRYEEVDLQRGPLRFAVAANGLVEFDSDGDDASMMRANIDYALMWRGFSSRGGLFVAAGQDGDAFSDQAFEAMGLRVQAGYFLGHGLQFAMRYAHVMPEGPDNDSQEIRGGLTLFIFEHNFKLQADGGALISEQPGADKRKDIVLRTQLQFAF